MHSIGSVAGANLTLIMSDSILKMHEGCSLPVVAICVLKDKNMDEVHGNDKD